MDLELIIEFTFGLIITIAVITSIGGIILLKPVFQHLGDLLESKVEERRALGRVSPEAFDRMVGLLEAVEDRLEAVERRQEFTEKLLEEPRQERSTEGGP